LARFCVPIDKLQYKPLEKHGSDVASYATPPEEILLNISFKLAGVWPITRRDAGLRRRLTMTTTKSVQCILGFNIALGSIWLFSIVMGIVTGLAHPRYIGYYPPAYWAGYTLGFLLVPGIAIAWLGANWYAYSKLCKLRKEISALPPEPPSHGVSRPASAIP